MWTAAGESRPKRPKIPTSAGKVIASVCWNAHGFFIIDYLSIVKTISILLGVIEAAQ